MLLIFFHLLPIITFLLTCTSKKMHYFNYYAMVSNTYFQKTSQSNEINTIQININRCNKKLLKKIINYTQVQYIKIKNSNFNNLFLKRHIYMLENSGFINSINKYTVFYTKYKQDIFNLTIYPVINQINVTEYKRLKICTNFLEKLLSEQLGMPKNPLLIDSIIHKIHSWYLLKGYKWSNVNINDKSQINNIALTINEGKIHAVYIKFKSKQIKKKISFMNLIIS
uniref:Orf220 n=1 Tax=Gracilaria firma TaxID=2510791 RepID=A0A2Z2JNG9_9FLOR|nr:orf220 [Gracilaria changii]ART65204.1 orf220 [Gracilaria changii]